MSGETELLRLPVVLQSQLDVRPIDWSGLTKRYMNPGELEVLVALVRGVSPKVVIEIGTNEGRTAKAILQNVDGIERYQGVDVEAGYVPAMKVQRQEVPDRPGWMAADNPRFELILRKRGSLDLEPRDLPECDVVFIDGDHGHAAVRHDIRLAEALVRPGGLIIYHDYHDLGTVDVKTVLEERSARGFQIQHVERTWLAFERR